MFGNLIKKVFGDKAQRDLKEVQPLVDRVKAEYDKLGSLSNDELRARTADLKQRITERTQDTQGRVDQLRAEIEGDPHMAINEREARYQEIDKLEEKTLASIEE